MTGLRITRRGRLVAFEEPVTLRVITETKIWAEIAGTGERILLHQDSPTQTVIPSGQTNRPNKPAITSQTAVPEQPTAELPSDASDLVPDGYTPIHVRPRAQTAILRNKSAEPGKKYAVLDMADRIIAGYATTTRRAGELMRDVNNKHKESIA